MTLVFGELVQEFTSFGIAALDYDSVIQSGNATVISVAQQNFDSAAAEFRRNAALGSSNISYIGILLFVNCKAQLIYLISAPGLGIFISTYIYTCIWIYTGGVNANRIREKYLQAILRQEMAYFDKVGPGEVTTRISTDTRERRLFFQFAVCSNKIDLVQQAMSEKVGTVISTLSAFITGFVLAYVRCWQLALAMTSMFPCMFITGAIMNKFASRYMRLVSPLSCLPCLNGITGNLCNK